MISTLCALSFGLCSAADHEGPVDERRPWGWRVEALHRTPTWLQGPQEDRSAPQLCRGLEERWGRRGPGLWWWVGFETEMGYDWVINLGDGTGSEFLTAAHLSIFICELKQRWFSCFETLSNFLFSCLMVCGLFVVAYFNSTGIYF